VTNLERSLKFYRDLLGAPLLYEGFPNDEVTFAGQIACVLLGGVGLDLQQHDANMGAQFESSTTGLDHLALSVPTRGDLEAFATLLDEAGVVHSPIREAGPILMFDFCDPDGIQLEFCWSDPERLKSWMESG
jgi:catechol 2,3-dioxygenase-like lactoylglutathione lyase family enzyme